MTIIPSTNQPCGICTHAESTDNNPFIWYPNHLSHQVHNNCFKKLKECHNLFYAKLHETFGNDCISAQIRALTWIEKNELTPNKTTLLEMLEDKEIGNLVVSRKMLEAATIVVNFKNYIDFMDAQGKK